MRRFALVSAMQWIAAIMLFATLPGMIRAEQPAANPAPAQASAQHQAKWDGSRLILFDFEDGPPGYPATNPYNILASMNAWTTPILDHNGKPHHHGDIVQVIMDGGNLRQDPPNPDGTPGGDDSLAFGNFNMMRLNGIENMADSTGQSGMFVSWKYFIPYESGRVYYLRLWEGKDVATAPYYQDTIEYESNGDRGGAMALLKDGTPMDLDWKFGPSKPRPGKAELKAKP